MWIYGAQGIINKPGCSYLLSAGTSVWQNGVITSNLAAAKGHVVKLD